MKRAANSVGSAEAPPAGARTEKVVARLTDAITGDPTLSSAVLQAANSAHVAARHRVTTVERAIAVLGLRAVGEILLRRWGRVGPR